MNYIERFYIEAYAGQWVVWDRETGKNNGYIYPRAMAQDVAVRSNAAGRFIEADPEERN